MSVQTFSPNIPGLVNSLASTVNHKDNFIEKIRNAVTYGELEKLYCVLKVNYSNEGTVVDAYLERQKEIVEAEREVVKAEREIVEKEKLKLIKRRCTFTSPDGTELSSLSFSNLIKSQIPPNTYLQVNVNTIYNYQFPKGPPQKARKIELIREEWGWTNVPVIQSLGAFVSSTFKSDSLYREVITGDTLMAGILASSLIVGDQESGATPNLVEKQNYEKQIVTAYWSGKKIEIIIPFDLEDNGVVSITSSSNVLTFSIETGRWIRSFFTKK